VSGQGFDVGDVVGVKQKSERRVVQHMCSSDKLVAQLERSFDDMSQRAWNSWCGLVRLSEAQ
jgi:hypothetical protein